MWVKAERLILMIAVWIEVVIWLWWKIESEIMLQNVKFKTNVSWSWKIDLDDHNLNKECYLIVMKDRKFLRWE